MPARKFFIRIAFHCGRFPGAGDERSFPAHLTGLGQGDGSSSAEPAPEGEPLPQTLNHRAGRQLSLPRTRLGRPPGSGPTSGASPPRGQHPSPHHLPSAQMTACVQDHLLPRSQDRGPPGPWSSHHCPCLPPGSCSVSRPSRSRAPRFTPYLH